MIKDYNLCDINDIKYIAKKHDFRFKKGLGQNFLIDPSICPNIARLGIDSEENSVIEIGTGFGVLTKELALVSNKVVAIEIDNRLPTILTETLSQFDNVKVINQDVLKVDLRKLISEEFHGEEVHLCANLPYYITSPILMYILEEKLPIKSVTVMVQKETAVRFCAKLGSRDSSAITFAINYYAKPTMLFDVNRSAFHPSPNVDSAVIRLDVKTKEELPQDVLDEEYLFKVVKAAFSQRRKTLPNPLSAGLRLPKDKIIALLESLNIPANSRAEQLTAEDFIKLSNELLTLR